MSIQYKVEANVVDITCDVPRSSDMFLVDTNVWVWYGYSNANAGTTTQQSSDYTDYLLASVGASSHIFNTVLSLSELHHIIEKTERELFAKQKGFLVKDFKPKVYRHHHTDQRKKVIREVEAAWSQVKSISTSIGVTIDSKMGNSLLSRMKSQPLDGYDLVILEAMKKEKIDKIITDDGDFATVAGITVFTANRNVINRAKKSRKLLDRNEKSDTNKPEKL